MSTEPRRPVTERFPREWRDYKWPRWIPEEMRLKILERWGPSSDGSPRLYHANSEDLGMPDNGERVEFPRFPVVAGGAKVSGRYVHLAGRSGYVVDDASRIYQVVVPLDWRGSPPPGLPGAALR